MEEFGRSMAAMCREVLDMGGMSREMASVGGRGCGRH